MTHTTQTTSTIGGTILSILFIPPATAFLTTIILAMTGALFSWLTTLLLKELWKKITSK